MTDQPSQKAGTETGVASAVEQIAPHVTLERLCGGRIKVLTVTSIDFETIDIWAETVNDLVRELAPGEPYLAVHDVSAPHLSLTPYIRRKAQEIFSAHPNAYGRIAVVVQRGVAGVMMQLFVNHLLRVVTGRPLRVFFNREDALVWLEELL